MVKLKYLLTHQLILLLVISLFAPFAAAQKRGNRQSQSAFPAPQQSSNRDTASSCSTGWRGKITYYGSTSGSSRSSVPVYGTDINSYSSQISGEIVLNGAATKPQGKISVQSKEKTETVGERKNCCYVTLAGCSKETTEKWNYTTEIEGSGIGEGEATGTVRVSGSRYKIHFTFPQARGKSETKSLSTMSGSCAAEMNKTQSGGYSEPDKIFPALQIQAEGRIDPLNPNVLQGSYSPARGATITWHLTRVPASGAQTECEGDLMISNLKLEHLVFPNKTEWKEIEGNTVDGNQVRLKAVVSNGAKQAKSGTITFRETMSGEILGTKSVSVPAGGEAEVELFWNTSGFAWTDSGEKMSNRRIEARLSTGDSTEADVVIYPKPVILVHGLWSNWKAWNDFTGYLREEHSFAWRAYPVGADPKNGKMNTGDHAGNNAPTSSIFENAQQLGKQIKAAQAEMNAWHVDLVAHSMGGLISRFFIHSFMPTDSPDGRPYITHLVMLGTPNMGSPCADLMYAAYKEAGFEVEALRQLKPSVVAEFNRQITNRKGVKFSILSGTPVPRTCQSSEWGDGVVSISSALWQINDRAFAARVHTDLTGKEDFKSFVKPRLALGPKKAKQEETAAFNTNQIGDSWLASVAPAVPGSVSQKTNEPRIISSKLVRIAPEGKTDVPLSFPANSQSGVTFIAPAGISVSLVRETDEEIEQIQTEQDNNLFRTIYLNGKAGNWTLRFENENNLEESAMFVAWSEVGNPVSLVILNVQSEDGARVFVQAKILSNGAPAANSPMTANLTLADGQVLSFQLFDDGNHDDEEAGDGVYGGRTDRLLSPGNYTVEVRSDGRSATALVSLP